MNEIYEKRQLAKHRAELYRAAAAKLVGVPVQHCSNVSPMDDGAFVEVAIWVPLTAIEPPRVNPTSPEGCTCPPTCSPACKGKCGCKPCHDACQDFLSAE